jgi:transposase-like protein
VAEEFAGEILHGPAKRHDLCRNLIRVWVAKYEAGAFDEDASAADLIQTYEARIAAGEVAQLPRQVTSPRSSRMHTLVLPCDTWSPENWALQLSARLTRSRACLGPAAATKCALARSPIFLEVVSWLTPLAEEVVVAWQQSDG